MASRARRAALVVLAELMVHCHAYLTPSSLPLCTVAALNPFSPSLLAAHALRRDRSSGASTLCMVETVEGENSANMRAARRVAKNLEAVRTRIGELSAKCGIKEPRLVAVSKLQPDQLIVDAHAAGQVA
eukprot:1660411-Rhodomonas_salina.1